MELEGIINYKATEKDLTKILIVWYNARVLKEGVFNEFKKENIN